MCIYSPMPHTLSYCALIGKCALIRSNTVTYLDDQLLRRRGEINRKSKKKKKRKEKKVTEER